MCFAADSVYPAACQRRGGPPCCGVAGTHHREWASRQSHDLTEQACQVACQWRPAARAKMLFQRDRRPGQIEMKIGQKEGEYSLTFTSSNRRMQPPTAATAPRLPDCCHSLLGRTGKTRRRQWRA